MSPRAMFAAFPSAPIAPWTAVLALAAAVALPAHAGTPPPPDWVLAAAHASIPDYPKTTKAVVLDSEEILTVGADGKGTLHERRVIRILRPQGRAYATVIIPNDRDRKIKFLHVWGIAADGHPYTLKDKEIVEIGNDEYGILYNDLQLKIAKAPAADPGAVIAYEYERTTRDYQPEYAWDFQRSIPALHTAFELILPLDWHYSVASRSESGTAARKDSGLVATQPAPGHYRWHLDSVPGIDLDNVPMTPEFESMAGRLVVRYSREAQPTGDALWSSIGGWYSTLAGPRATVTPEISAKAQELVAGQTDFTAKVQSIADYMQRKVRYVGIEIGIGGLQPHTADDIFRNHYGDCKDKATLLRAMLESVGIHSTWVLVDTRRGYVDPKIPSSFGNHAIAAIELPAGYTNPILQSVVTGRGGKRYLIFDPTNEWVPLGQIPPYEQGGYGILSDGAQSQLIELPRMAPDADVIDHTILATLLADGSLDVSVTEKRFGYAAESSRATFSGGSQQQQHDFVEERLRGDLSGVSIKDVAAAHTTDLSHPLELNYSFQVSRYARSAGDLLLVRPRIFGSDSLSLPQEPRVWPIDLGAIQRRTDHIDIAIPAGYVSDELPDPVSLDTDFASYHSAVTADASTLHYTREYTVKQLELEPSRYEDLRKFTERIAYDEATSAVLKKK
jgi:transglutaminase-like putative cysteine protease